ncbi:MAG: redoxin domain-containing protein [Anaerolineaceae bacterium]|nr:redoxin domain-containing protein [Anaerolineaceae bacterium]
MEKYNALSPKAGDPAPDFELRDVDGENPVRLSEFRGKKPVALIFGSHT